jgi:hypothetical protein
MNVPQMMVIKVIPYISRVQRQLRRGGAAGSRRRLVGWIAAKAPQADGPDYRTSHSESCHPSPNDRATAFRREMAETAQRVELLLAKPRNIDERRRSVPHREQTQDQHLVQRITHLASLPRVR